MSRFSGLLPVVQERLRGTSRRRRVARAILEHLPFPGSYLTTNELADLTGYDRVDVGNALRFLRELGVAQRDGKKLGQWMLASLDNLWVWQALGEREGDEHA